MTPWVCWACRHHHCGSCDRLRGCEHIGQHVDGSFVPCAGLVPRQPKPREGQ